MMPVLIQLAVNFLKVTIFENQLHLCPSKTYHYFTIALQKKVFHYGFLQ